MTDNDLKNVVRKLYAAFNTGDLGALDVLVSDAFVEHEDTPGIPPNKDGLKQFVVMLRQAFPDAVFEVADSAAELDKVWTRVVVTGTQRGTYFGIPPTGRTIRIEVFDICRISHNQITEHWGLSDQMGVHAAIGRPCEPWQVGLRDALEICVARLYNKQLQRTVNGITSAARGR